MSIICFINRIDFVRNLVTMNISWGKDRNDSFLAGVFYGTRNYVWYVIGININNVSCVSE